MFDSLCTCPLTCSLASVVLLCMLYKLADYLWRLPTVSVPKDSRCLLITGCDSGFGRLLANRMAGKGWCVFAACLSQKAVDELSAGDKNLMPVKMDVTKPESIKVAIEKVEIAMSQRGLKGLWGLVNNAGIGGSKIGPMEWMTQDDLHEVFSVNTYGIVNVTRACLPLMRRLNRSRMVNMSSILGRYASPSLSAYSASKYAVQAISDCYRRDLSQFGCHVACLEPGGHRTAILDPAYLQRALRKAYNEAPPVLRDPYGERFLEQSIQYTDQFLNTFCSTRLNEVVDAYEAALTSKHPRCRYMIGWDAKFFFWPLSVLPEWVGDRLNSSMTPRAAKAVA